MRSMISTRRRAHHLGSGARTTFLLLVALLAWGCGKPEHVRAFGGAEAIYVRVLNPTPVDIDSVAVYYEESTGGMRRERTLELSDESQESEFEQVDSANSVLRYCIYTKGRMVGLCGHHIDGPMDAPLPPGKYTYRVRLEVEKANRDSFYCLIRDN